MITLQIDGREVQVEDGQTVLQAAEKLGIEIPTLCHLEGLPSYTSCMVCVCADAKSGRLFPSCGFPAAEGMQVDASSDTVKSARRDALELLLSEHVGDCEAPCQQVCPASLDIARMARDVQNDNQIAAIAGIKENLALPAVLGYVCPAPCEKGCRRGGDDHLSIRLMHRSVAEADLAADKPWMPDCAKHTDKRVAIVGAGPAGLSAAYYLRQYGHACVILDAGKAPGGQLRTAEMEERPLPLRVLDDEVARIQCLGVDIRQGEKLGETVTLTQLQQDYDAVILALGKMPIDDITALGLDTARRGVQVDSFTLQTSQPGVFAAGGFIHGLKLAVRAVGDGRIAAAACDQYLRGAEIRGARPRFNSKIGKMQAGELKAFLGQASTGAPISSTGGCDGECYTEDESAREGERCLACDCRKADSCKLRQYAEEYDAKQNRFAGEDRKRVVILRDHGNVVFEPGKCIKCGICTRICEQHREELGLAFVGRGFDVNLTVPFGNTIADGMRTCANEVVDACPTAALAFAEHERLSVPGTASKDASPAA
jgi:hypothetical protein